MRAWRMVACAAVAVGLAALAASALQREEGPAQPGPTYKVTAWPINTGGRPYTEDVERLLNEAAAQGWRLHSALAGQGAKMLVFEKVGDG